MPLYYFHLRTEDGLERDEEGLPFPDLDAAYLEAYETVPAMAQELLRGGSDPLRCAFVIADAVGRPLMEIPFRERLKPAPAPARAPRPVSSQTEQAHQLIDAVRHEHVRLRENLERMRALIADNGAPGESRR